jgi:hypothetical protein
VSTSSSARRSRRSPGTLGFPGTQFAKSCGHSKPPPPGVVIVVAVPQIQTLVRAFVAIVHVWQGRAVAAQPIRPVIGAACNSLRGFRITFPCWVRFRRFRRRYVLTFQHHWPRLCPQASVTERPLALPPEGKGVQLWVNQPLSRTIFGRLMPTRRRGWRRRTARGPAGSAPASTGSRRASHGPRKTQKRTPHRAHSKPAHAGTVAGRMGEAAAKGAGCSKAKGRPEGRPKKRSSKSSATQRFSTRLAGLRRTPFFGVTFAGPPFGLTV